VLTYCCWGFFKEVLLFVVPWRVGWMEVGFFYGVIDVCRLFDLLRDVCLESFYRLMAR